MMDLDLVLHIDSARMASHLFQRGLEFLGRLSFVEITDSDAGLYQVEVEGKNVQYSKTINLLGM